VPTLREAETAGNTYDVDVDQQWLIIWARGNSLPDDPLPGVPLHNIPLPNGPLLQGLPDGSVGEE